MHIYLWLLRASFLVISTTAFYPLRPLDVLPGTPKVADGSEKRILSPMRGDDGRIQKRKHMKLSMKRKAAPVSTMRKAIVASSNRVYQIHSHSHHWSGIELEAIDRRNSKDLNKKDNQEITELHPRTQVRRSNDYKIVTASQPKQTDSVAIDQDGTDFSYFSAIQLGERGKIMRVLVDTGAANTWVMGSNCTSGPCLTHNTFGAKDSNTMHTTTAEFNLAYGTGTVSGLIVNDTVKMAGFLLPLYFGAASVVSDDFSWYPVDGILGLGRPASNIVKFPTIMEAIDKSKLLQKNLIGINLQRNADRSTDGELNFGSPDRTKYSGDLSYTKTVQAKERWEIPIDDAGVNGFACGFSNKTAIIDTGTSFVLLPPADAKLIHNQIPDSQQTGEQFNVPCTSELPVQIIISGVTYNISAKDYVGNPINSGNLCSSNIVGKAAFGPDQWLVGDVFLKNVYTVLDFDEERIG